MPKTVVHGCATSTPTLNRYRLGLLSDAQRGRVRVTTAGHIMRERGTTGVGSRGSYHATRCDQDVRAMVDAGWLTLGPDNLYRTTPLGDQLVAQHQE